MTGAVDLISHYHLREQYETFCKKPLPTSIADSKYFSNVVGDTELRRGEGMELGQLLQGEAGSSIPSDRVPFQSFDIEVLRKAFTLKETGPISLPEVSSLCHNNFPFFLINDVNVGNPFPWPFAVFVVSLIRMGFF